MKSLLERLLPQSAFNIFFVMAIWFLITWVFVRFVHYTSQISVLPADAYQVKLITTDDYAKLQDRSLYKVTLSDGTAIMDRQPSWYEVILPNYKRVGDHYVLVRTLGTAHYYRRWITDAVPVMIFTVLGIFASYWELRRRNAGNSEADSSES